MKIVRRFCILVILATACFLAIETTTSAQTYCPARQICIDDAERTGNECVANVQEDYDDCVTTMNTQKQYCISDADANYAICMSDAQARWQYDNERCEYDWWGDIYGQAICGNYVYNAYLSRNKYVRLHIIVKKIPAIAISSTILKPAQDQLLSDSIYAILNMTVQSNLVMPQYLAHKILLKKEYVVQHTPFL